MSAKAEGTIGGLGVAPAPVMIGRPGDAALTDHLLTPIWTRALFLWPLFAMSAMGIVLLALGVAYSVFAGPGAWGNQIPVAWAFPIINFVWWIGIGHAGTFISAFLLLLEQRWRASVNRLAEAMTIFALVNAGLFPLLHLGRPWFFYWLLPYPATMQVWPQFKSTLPWDIAAVSTYFLVSLMFWYLGLVPDLATARDRAPGRLRRRIYGVFALGWRGSGRQWHLYHSAYLVLAGLATPLVISVHSIVSLDFTIALVPGWHSTVFPPYFVVGAIYSGFAMVFVLLLPVRFIYRLGDVVTERHVEAMAKLLLALAWMMAYSYAVETFTAWYSGSEYERQTYLSQRPFGPYAGLYWLMLACNVFIPQVLWWGRARRSTPILIGVSLGILLGMWLERFIIIAGSLTEGFLPSSWHVYVPTVVDWAILLGTLGLFVFLFLAFLRWVPFVALSELKQLRHELQREDAREAGGEPGNGRPRGGGGR